MKKNYVMLIVMLFLIVIISSLVSAIPSGGVLNYEFGTGSGTSIVDSWNSHTGTSSGMTWSTNYPSYGTSGNGASYSGSFDGTSDRVLVPLNITEFDFTTSGATISLWVNSTDDTTEQDVIYFKDNAQNNNPLIALRITTNAGDDDFSARGTTGICSVTENDLLDNNVWTHITITITDNGASDNVSVYKNGVFVASAVGNLGVLNFSSLSGSANERIVIGESTTDNTNNFYGLIDSVQIFNRPLSSIEILNQHNYNNISGAGGSTNNAPVVTSSTILPSTAYTSNTLLGYCTSTDDDSARLNYVYQWYKEGVHQSNGTLNNASANYTQGVEILIGNISSSLTSVGDNWSLRCLSNDGTNNSAWLNSSLKIITADPIVPGVFYGQLYYEFITGSGTNITDYGGNNTGTATSMTWSTNYPSYGTSGNGASYSGSFDGTDDLVKIGNSADTFDFVNGFTISLWVNSTDDTTEQDVIYFRDNSQSNTPVIDFRITTNAGDDDFSVRGTTGTCSVTENDLLDNGAWTHIIAVLNRSTTRDIMQIYKNGVLVDTNNCTDVGILNFNDLPNTASKIATIGVNADLNGGWFSGEIDTIKIYNSTRSPSEVSSLYENNNNILFILRSSRISPLTAYTSTDLLGYCNATEGNGVNVSYYYKWYNGNVVNVSGYANNSDSGFVQGVETLVNTLSSSLTSIGDSWKFECIAKNITSLTTGLNSSALVISSIEPSIILNSPLNYSVSSDNFSILNVTILNSSSSYNDVRFYRKNSSSTNFTLVQWTDTQRNVGVGYGDSAVMTNNMTQYMVDTAVAKNTKFVIHTGDIVEHMNSNEVEWQRINESVSILDDANIPNGLITGNHDVSSSSVYTYFDKYFPLAKYSSLSWFEGAQASAYRPFAMNFTGGGQTFMVIGLDYCTSASSLTWVNETIKNNSAKKVIIATHVWLESNTTYGGDADSLCTPDTLNAQQIWDGYLKYHSNIFMILSGHYSDYDASRNITQGVNGNNVTEIMFNTMARPNYGNGYTRFYEFDPVNGVVSAYTYSSYAGASLTTDAHDFTFNYDSNDDILLSSQNGSIGESIFYSWADLSIGAYEWYVVVNNTYDSFTSKTYYFNVTAIDITAPVITAPVNVSVNQIVNWGSQFTASETIDTWWVNDTNFVINSTGYLTNATNLSVKNHSLLVSANDTSGNIGTREFSVIIFVSTISINAVTILPATAYTNNTLLGYCNGSSTSDNTVNFYWKWYKNGVSYSSGNTLYFNWTENTSLVTGLPDVGDYASPSLFMDSDMLKLISGEKNGGVSSFNGFQWNGTSWISNSSIVNGLGYIGNHSTPFIFNDSGTLKLISGELSGIFNGFQWNGNSWISNSSIVNGLGDVGEYSAPTIFNHYGTLKLISGEYYGLFYGFQWNGNSWISNSSIVNGLGDVGTYSAPTIFNDSGKLKMVTGEGAGIFLGYQWNGTSWISNSSIVNGLGDVGSSSRPSFINHSGKLKLIIGNSAGAFRGFDRDFSDNNNSNKLLNIANISSNLISKNDTWIFSCQAKNRDESSAWLNSSVLTISNTAPVITNVSVFPGTPNFLNDLSFTNTSSDLNNDTITNIEVKWYKNGAVQSGLENVTSVGAGNTSVGENWSVSLKIFDGESWSNVFGSLNSTIIAGLYPYIYSYSLSSSSGVDDTAFVVYGSILSLTNLTSFNVEVTDPNSVKNNFSMIRIGSTSAYSKTYIPGTDGVYSVKLFATNINGTFVTSALSYTESSSTPPTGGGGGGGGTTIIIGDKKDCDLGIVDDLTIREVDKIYSVRVKNDDTLTISPSIEFASSNNEILSSLEITNPLQTIIPGATGEFGIKYTNNIIDNGEASITITSSNCNDVVIPVFINIGELNIVQEIEEFLEEPSTETFMELVSTPIINIETSSKFVEFISSYAGVFMFSIFLIGSFLINFIRLNFKEGKGGLAVFYIFATIILSVILTFVTAWIIGGFT